MKAEHHERKQFDLDLSDWIDYVPKHIPGQENGYDCGVFMCTYGEYISRDAPFDFSQANMPYLRRRMMYEILSKKLCLDRVE